MRRERAYDALKYFRCRQLRFCDQALWITVSLAFLKSKAVAGHLSFCLTGLAYRNSLFDLHTGCPSNVQCPWTVLGLRRAGFSKGGDLDDSALCLCTFVAPAFSDLFPFWLRFQNRVSVSRATRRVTKPSNWISPVQRSLCGDRGRVKRGNEKKGMNGSSFLFNITRSGL